MIVDSKSNVELEQLRRILLGPMEETNELRDKKILDFLKSETTDTNERLDRIEARLSELSEAVENDRRDTLTEIGEAISDLGDHLKRHAYEAPTENGHGDIQDAAVNGNLRDSVVRILK